MSALKLRPRPGWYGPPASTAISSLDLWRLGCRRVGCRCGGCMRRGGWRVRGSRAGGCHRARRLRSRGAAGEGHQRNVAGALDRYAEPALMTRAHSRHAARKNLAALLHELRQNVSALVIDEVHLLDAKLADFFLPEILALSAARPAGTATGSAGSAFAPRTTVTATGSAVAAAGSMPT